MNDKKEIKDNIMHFAKELIVIRDTDDTAWLLKKSEKASEKLTEYILNIIKQREEEAIVEFVGWCYKKYGAIQMEVGLDAEEYLSKTKGDK